MHKRTVDSTGGGDGLVVFLRVIFASNGIFQDVKFEHLYKSYLGIL